MWTQADRIAARGSSVAVRAIREFHRKLTSKAMAGLLEPPFVLPQTILWERDVIDEAGTAEGAMEGSLADALIASYLESAARVAGVLPARGAAANSVLDPLMRLVGPYGAEFLRRSTGLFIPEAPLYGPVEPPEEPLSLLYGTKEPTVRYPSLERAVVRLWAANVMSPEKYYAIASEAKSKAFTVTANLSHRMLDNLSRRLAEVTATSGNRSDFRRIVRNTISSEILSDSHIEMVYRNNVQSAYSDGQNDVLSNFRISDAFPYRGYAAIHDERVRVEHKQLEKLGIQGTNIYHKDDPVWHLFRPPWDWGCRCAWYTVTLRQAAKLGIEEAKKWLATGVEPEHEFVEMPDFEPSPEWRRAA